MNKLMYGEVGASKSNSYSRCKKCYRLLSDQGLEQQICGAKYCTRCVCQIYQPYYLSKQPVDIIEMYCGHFVEKNTIAISIDNCCINCGSTINAATDIQMRDRAKLCRICFKYAEDKYQECLIECMSCNRIIRTLQFLADTEITMCKDCAKTQTSIQSSITQSRTTMNNELRQGSRAKQKIEYQEQQPSQQVSIVSRFSALQKEEQGGRKEHKLKLSSKHSVQIRVQNYKIKIKQANDKLQVCSVCNSSLSRQFLMSENMQQLICRVCFMGNNNQRDMGFYFSFIKCNTEQNQRLKHVSAPKNKALLFVDAQSKSKGMKYSQIFEEPKLVKQLKQKYSIAAVSYKKYTPQPWQHKQLDKSKLCEICHKKAYNIIRVDKKKCCQTCHSK